MATITRVCRKSGDAYKAVIRLRGSKAFSTDSQRGVWKDRHIRDSLTIRAGRLA
jgi:hypothetical protein